MTLHQILSEKVAKCEIGWETVLHEIDRIKTEQRKEKEALDCCYNCNTVIPEDLDMIINQNCLSPYQVVLKKELWNNLSVPAKQTVDMILDSTPEDFRRNRFGNKLFTPVLDHRSYSFSRKRLTSVLKINYNFSLKEIASIFDEIRVFVKGLMNV